MAVDVLRQEAIGSLDDQKRQDLVEKFDSATKCVRKLSLLIGYKSKIGTYLKQVEELAKNTELSPLIPVTDILPYSQLSDKYEIFVELSAILKDLDDICRNFQIHMGLAQPDLIISYAPLQAGLKNIQTRLSISGEIVDFTRWNSLYLQADSKRDAARLLLSLIEAVFAGFQRQLELPFDRLSAHYQTFLERFYPLPTEHFLPGN
jgi:hypothetical protein